MTDPRQPAQPDLHAPTDLARARTAPRRGDEPEDNEFLRYARIIWERKWLVLACVVLCLVFTVIQLRRSTNIYVATSTIKYEPSSARYVDFGEVGRPINAIDEIRTQVEVIRGPLVTLEVIHSLGLDRAVMPADLATSSTAESEGVFDVGSKISVAASIVRRNFRSILVPTEKVEVPREDRRQQWLISSIRERVSVRQYQDTKLIDIIVRDSDPRRAANIANAYAQQYMLSLNAKKTKSYGTARKFFDEQLTQARANLVKANQDLLAYSAKQNTDLQLMEQESEISLDMTKTIQQEIEQLKNQIAQLEAQESTGNSEAIKAHLLSLDKTYNDYNTRIADIQLQRVALIAENTEDNPTIQRLDRQISSLNEQLSAYVTRFNLENTGEALLARQKLTALEARLKEEQNRFNEIQRQLVEYKPLRMSVDVQQQLYDQLLARAKEIDVAAEFEPDNVTIQAVASIPSFPSEPRVIPTLATNTFLSALVGCALALLLGLLDRSIHDPAVVALKTGYSSLAVIPNLGGGIKRRLGARVAAKLINEFDPYSPQVEAFRLLRTGLQYSTAGRTPQVVMITSCSPAEGKSTVSANLAVAFASLGERTLLVDADLKLPNQHRVFQVKQQPGLTDVLIGQKGEDAVIAPVSRIPNLSILPAGPSAPNPVELLDSKEMVALLERLRGKYERIVLDTAPLEGLSDAYVLANKADGVCVVASLGRTHFEQLRRDLVQLSNLRGRVLGIVFNDQSGHGLPRKRGYGIYGALDYVYQRRRGHYDSRGRHKSDDAVSPKT